MTISPESISLPGVRERDFAHYSRLHGAGHVNRVIVMGQILAHVMGETPSVRLALWGASYTHDLARRHDEVCYMHGTWAVGENLPGLWNSLFKPRGLADDQYKAVKSAVIWHSRATEPPAGHPHRHLIALLKDADALDRCRLRADEFDPKYLRFRSTHGLIGLARELFSAGHDTEDLDGMWEWMTRRLSMEGPPGGGGRAIL